MPHLPPARDRPHRRENVPAAAVQAGARASCSAFEADAPDASFPCCYCCPDIPLYAAPVPALPLQAPAAQARTHEATRVTDKKLPHTSRVIRAQAVISFVSDTKTKKTSKAAFSKDDLRKLFIVNNTTPCDTLDMLTTVDPERAKAWADISLSADDAVLRAGVSTGVVSYAHLAVVRGEAAAEALDCEAVDTGAVAADDVLGGEIVAAWAASGCEEPNLALDDPSDSDEELAALAEALQDSD